MPDHEIISTRLFHFPRALVWRAWTDPVHLARWWGPQGFRNTFQTFEPRPGGQWRFVMHGPDGRDYPNHSTFVEIVPSERIVFNHISPPQFQVVATFAEKTGGTHVTFRMIFPNAELCAGLKGIVVPANEQNFDRLAAELQEMSATSAPLPPK